MADRPRRRPAAHDAAHGDLGAAISDARDAAERLLAEGRDHNTVGRWRRADRSFARALGATGDDPALRELRARIHVSRALARLHLLGPDAALDLLALAQVEAEVSGSRYAGALADVQESVIRLETGAWADGLAVLRRVRIADLRQPMEQMAVLLNRGLAQVTLLELEAGRTDLEAALDLAIAQDWPALEFKARHNLGCLEYFAGRLPTAISLMRAADAMPVDIDRVRAKHDYGQVLLEAGLVDEARVQLEDALERARSDRLKLDEGEIRLDLARAALLEDDLVVAAGEAARAARAFASRRDAARSRSARLLAEAVDLARGGPGAAAAVVDAEAEPRPEDSTAEARLAARLRAEGILDTRPEEARASLAAVRPRREGVAPLMYDRYLTARAEVGCGRVPAARRILRAAAERLALQRGQLQSLEARAATAIHGRRLAAFDLELAMADGSPRALFECVERWRATSYRVDASAVEDPVARELLTRLRVARHIFASPDESPERVAIARADAVDLEGRISEHLWSLASDGPAAASAPVPYAVARGLLLERGERLVSFVVQGGDYVRLTVGDGRSRVDRLGPAVEVERRVRQLTDDLRARTHARPIPALTGVIDRAVASSAASVDALLLRGLRLDGDSGALLLGPSPALVSLPWSLLPSLRGRALLVAPSVTRWARDTGMRAGRVDVATVAGPDLATAATEARSVGGLWRHSPHGAEVTVRTTATAADLEHAMATAHVVHVAAHGVHEEQNPAFSSIRLGDGPVFVHELPRPPAAEHVVLSACEVGRSRMRADAEPLGLTAGLLAVGVRSVVASVAPVDDEVASATMRRYHRELAGGRPATQALASAVADEPGAATFCVYGADWGVTSD